MADDRRAGPASGMDFSRKPSGDWSPEAEIDILEFLGRKREKRHHPDHYGKQAFAMEQEAQGPVKAAAPAPAADTPVVPAPDAGLAPARQAPSGEGLGLGE